MYSRILLALTPRRAHFRWRSDGRRRSPTCASPRPSSSTAYAGTSVTMAARRATTLQVTLVVARAEFSFEEQHHGGVQITSRGASRGGKKARHQGRAEGPHRQSKEVIKGIFARDDERSEHRKTERWTDDR